MGLHARAEGPDARGGAFPEGFLAVFGPAEHGPQARAFGRVPVGGPGREGAQLPQALRVALRQTGRVRAGVAPGQPLALGGAHGARVRARRGQGLGKGLGHLAVGPEQGGIGAYSFLHGRGGLGAVHAGRGGGGRGQKKQGRQAQAGQDARRRQGGAPHLAGTGFTPQMSRAYSRMVRSEEKAPMRATLRMALAAQTSGRENSMPMRSWASR